MRHTLCALVGVVLVACCSPNLAAAETGSRWWPFGHRDEAKVAQPPAVATPSTSPLLTPQPNSTMAPLGPAASAPLAHQAQLPNSTADTAAKEHWMLSSPNGKIGWPHLNKPQLPSALAAKKPPTEVPRNSWVEQPPITPKASPLKPITDGAHKVGKSTKAAWHKTVDALTPGEPTPSRSSGARIAKRDVQPPFWKRMFGAKPESKGSQTVPEFMAQQRLDP
jgi:hypothetical protein